MMDPCLMTLTYLAVKVAFLNCFGLRIPGTVTPAENYDSV